MRAHGLSDVSLLISELSRHARPLGEELHLLYHPVGAMCLALGLAHDLASSISLSRGYRHRFSRRTTRTDQVTHCRAGLSVGQRTFEVLTPQRALATAREKLQIVGLLLGSPKLIVGPSVCGQATDDQLAVSAS